MLKHRKKFTLFLFGLILAFIFSLILDNILGFYLNKSGYFKAMTPNLNEIHDTNEFEVITKLSSQGLRDDEVTIPKPKDVYRIMALGDSFTYGYGAKTEEAWPDILEKNLKIEGKKVEVINGGKPGASPLNTRHICKAYAEQFEVDAFIYALYSDDLAQAATRELDLEARPIYDFIVSTWPTLSRMAQPIIDYRRYGKTPEGSTVRGSDFAKKRVLQLLLQDPQLLTKINPTLRDDFVNGKINPSILTNAINNPYFYLYILDQDDFSFALNALNIRLERLKDRCTKDKPATVVFIPSSELVSEDYFEAAEEIGYLVDAQLTKFDMDTPLKNLAETESFHYLSVLSEFRSNGCKDCYYPYDGHLTVTGQKRLADYLINNLQGVFK